MQEIGDRGENVERPNPEISKQAEDDAHGPADRAGEGRKDGNEGEHSPNNQQDGGGHAKEGRPGDHGDGRGNKEDAGKRPNVLGESVSGYTKGRKVVYCQSDERGNPKEGNLGRSKGGSQSHDIIGGRNGCPNEGSSQSQHRKCGYYRD